MRNDEDLMYKEPPENQCRVREGNSIVGKKVMIRASSIPPSKLRPTGGHRKQWTKAENAKCWIEQEIELRHH